MAVKDEKMADADAEQTKLKKQKQKKKGQKGDEDKEADLSEEDLELKKNLELMLERAKDTDSGVQKTALDGIAREIRSTIRDLQCEADKSCSRALPVQAAIRSTVYGELLACYQCCHVLCRESTTSMTSVPKPLKFLRSHYKELKDLYESLPASNQNKASLADIVSVMAITSGKEGARESLQYRYARALTSACECPWC